MRSQEFTGKSYHIPYKQSSDLTTMASHEGVWDRLDIVALS